VSGHAKRVVRGVRAEVVAGRRFQRTRPLAHRWRVLASLALCLVAACRGVIRSEKTDALSPRAPLPGYALVWADEFDGTALDPLWWTVASELHHHAENTPDAVSVAGGLLTIRTFTEHGRHFTGWVTTAGKLLFTHGWFEARVRFQSSPGEWGAFWMASPTIGNPLGDPAVAGAEIDVVEHRRTRGSGADISGAYAMNVHWDGYGVEHKHVGSYGWPAVDAPRLQGGWHVYAVSWTPDGYRFFLDGVEQWATRWGVSQRPEFILLTCEVEHGAWAGAIPAHGYGSRRLGTTRMQVDWVRVWQPVQ
jgi:beta-glucanase (GH16 family)